MRKISGSIFIALLFLSCQNEAAWYPSAEVEISIHYEFDTPVAGNGLMITFIINNTGKTLIVRGKCQSGLK